MCRSGAQSDTTLQAEDGIPSEAWEPGTAAPPGGDVWDGCSLPAACQVASVVSDSATSWTVRASVRGILQVRTLQWDPPPGDLPNPGIEI